MRFHLRHMFAFASAIAVLCGLIRYGGGNGIVAFVLIAIAMFIRRSSRTIVYATYLMVFPLVALSVVSMAQHHAQRLGATAIESEAGAEALVGALLCGVLLGGLIAFATTSYYQRQRDG